MDSSQLDVTYMYSVVLMGLNRHIQDNIRNLIIQT